MRDNKFPEAVPAKAMFHILSALIFNSITDFSKWRVNSSSLFACEWKAQILKLHAIDKVNNSAYKWSKFIKKQTTHPKQQALHIITR